jgi:hypothetical protein
LMLQQMPALEMMLPTGLRRASYVGMMPGLPPILQQQQQQQGEEMCVDRSPSFTQGGLSSPQQMLLSPGLEAAAVGAVHAPLHPPGLLLPAAAAVIPQQLMTAAGGGGGVVNGQHLPQLLAQASISSTQQQQQQLQSIQGIQGVRPAFHFIPPPAGAAGAVPGSVPLVIPGDVAGTEVWVPPPTAAAAAAGGGGTFGGILAGGGVPGGLSQAPGHLHIPASGGMLPFGGFQGPMGGLTALCPWLKKLSVAKVRWGCVTSLDCMWAGCCAGACVAVYALQAVSGCEKKT